MAKVITLKQPFAELVVLGLKRMETRSFKTNFRGQIYIHSSAHFHFSDLELCYQDDHYRNAITHPQLLETGKIIGSVWITDMNPTDELYDFLAEHDRRELAFGDYRPGRWAWKLRDAIKFSNPHKCRGSLGLWDFDDSQIEFDTITQ